jgi:hypothetical protein
MADKKRRTPNIWAKALAKLIGGDERCWYRGWYQSRHYTTRPQESPEDVRRLEDYQKAHDRIVTERADYLRSEGYVVKTEDENAFKLVGKTAELTGKPDIVAIQGDQALVVDGKSGKRRPADAWQVKVYQFALPLTWLRAERIFGEVAYADVIAGVPELTKQDAGEIDAGIRVLSSSEKIPAKVPGKWECLRCPVADCAVRFSDAAGAGETEMF